MKEIDKNSWHFKWYTLSFEVINKFWGISDFRLPHPDTLESVNICPYIRMLVLWPVLTLGAFLGIIYIPIMINLNAMTSYETVAWWVPHATFIGLAGLIFLVISSFILIFAGIGSLLEYLTHKAYNVKLSTRDEYFGGIIKAYFDTKNSGLCKMTPIADKKKDSTNE